MKTCTAVSVVVSCLALASSALSDNSNWPQWRGPEGTGKTPAASVITQWGPDTNVKWRTELPEPGNSTPIVWGDRVFVTQPLSESKQRAILCFDRNTGNEKWRRGVTYTAEEASHKTNPYCSASPVTDGQRVIAWFGSAGLVCWDLDGTELWRRDLGPQEHMWGHGSSPILYEDLCILNFGPGNREFLIAVDKHSGETRWQVETLTDATERELSGAENDGHANDFHSDKARSERLRGAWNTPIMVQIDGQWELIAMLPRRVSGFDPATGELLWTCGDGAPLAYASPIESNGLIVALGGHGGASLAVSAGGRGDVTQTRRFWHKPRDSGWLGTGVAHDGAVYISGIGGVLSCLDVATGEELWKARCGGGGTWSSITQTKDGLMYLLSKSGITTVFRPNREAFERVAENDLQESTNASVVITDNEVLIRTDDALWAFAAPSQTESE